MALYIVHTNFTNDALYETDDVASFTVVPSTAFALTDVHPQFGSGVMRIGPGEKVYVAVNPDATFFAEVYAFDPSDGTFVALGFPLEGFNSHYTQLAYDPDRERLYVASDASGDGVTLQYWDGATWTEIDDGTLLEPEDDATFSNAICVGKGPTAGILFALSGLDTVLTGQRIYRWNPDTEAWTEDAQVLPASVFGTDVFLPARMFASETGEIYLITETSETTATVVFKRSVGGVWSNISEATMTGPSTASSIEEYNGDLFVGWYNEIFDRAEIWKRTAAGVWSLDFDMLADDPASFGMNAFVVFGGELYAFTGNPGYMLKRTGEATWEHVVTPGSFTSAAEFAEDEAEFEFNPDDRTIINLIWVEAYLPD